MSPRGPGFDRPLALQYLSYITDLAQGDLWQSLVQRAPVSLILGSRLPYTLALAAGALLVALVIGIPAGIAMAVWRGSAVERGLAVMVLARKIHEGWRA